MNQQATGLEKDIEYIKTDIAGMKTDIRRLNDKTDSIIASVSVVREEIGAVHAELKELISSKTNWAIFLYVALAGVLLLVMARGFEWL